MRYNEVIEYEITTDLQSEPVTLEELKRHLNMQFDTQGSYDFDDDDTLLESIITSSRKYLENYTGLSFGSKTIVAVLRNELGEIEIPFGPIISITSVRDDEDEVLTTDDYETLGRRFIKIVSPTYSYLEVTYTAGFTALPADLHRAILEEAAFRYNHRGEEMDVTAYCKSSLELASPYKRSAWLV